MAGRDSTGCGTVGAVGETEEAPSEPTAAVVLQVTEEETEEVPTPDASVHGGAAGLVPVSVAEV